MQDYKKHINGDSSYIEKSSSMSEYMYYILSAFFSLQGS